MQKPTAAQKAKARLRARAKRRAPPERARDNVVPFEPPEPFALTAEYVVPEPSHEALFAPPPADDILGVNEFDEEETTFIDEAEVAEVEAEVFAEAAVEAEVEVEPEPEPEAELAPVEADASEEFEEDLPFDPPEFDDEPVFSPPVQILEPIVLTKPAPIEPVAVAAPEPKPLQPREAPRYRAAPALSIFAAWDRREAEAMITAMASDPLLARTHIQVRGGGLDAAVAHFADGARADLVLLDTTLQGAPMLAGLDRLRATLPAGAKIIVIGAVNDIGLLRELAARGVSDYIVPPAGAQDLVHAVCRLFADSDPARVFAVIGARGGVGASTIARNLAWSIAHRQGASTTLVDLDLSFGQPAPELSIADVLKAGENAEAMLPTALARQGERLHLLGAPKTPECAELDPEALETLLSQVRRTGAYVVLDIPHIWAPWVRHALCAADEIVIVATPELAALRDADNILKVLRAERDKPSVPLIAVSMLGVPKRPEIPVKDFAEALALSPSVTFAFEPDLFGAAGQAFYEAAPKSKAAMAIDTLATLLTAREAVLTPAEHQPAPAPKPQTEPAPMPAAVREEKTERPPEAPVLELTTLAPPAKVRRVARSEVLAMQAAPRKRRRRGSPGLLRAAMAVLALVITTSWYAQQREPANAAEPVAARIDSASSQLADLRRQAEGGHAPSQYRLAKAFERGEGVAANLTLARAWTERAAEAGNVSAMHDLGVYYARGEGGVAGDAGSFRWFRQAAEYGVAQSQYNLGVLYDQGRGVTPDAAEALFWFTLAAKSGDAGAAERVTALEAALTPMQIEQARSRADAFTPRAPDPAANGA